MAEFTKKSEGRKVGDSALDFLIEGLGSVATPTSSTSSTLAASAPIIAPRAGGGGAPVGPSYTPSILSSRSLEKIKTSSSTKRSYIVKIAFLMDVTGSMSSARDAVVKKIAEIIDETVDTFFPKIGIEAGFVGYRDVCDGSNQFVLIPFTDILANETNLGKFIDSVKAVEMTGGGDLPENVLGGMDYALKELFGIDSARNKTLVTDPSIRYIPVVFHLCDAPHHGKKFTDQSDNHPNLEELPRPYSDILDEYANNKIDYYFAALRSPPDSPTGKVYTTQMSKIFKEHYNTIQRRKNDFEILDFTTFDLKSVFKGIVDGLSKSVNSYLAKPR